MPITVSNERYGRCGEYILDKWQQMKIDKNTYIISGICTKSKEQVILVEVNNRLHVFKPELLSTELLKIFNKYDAAADINRNV